MTSDVIGVSGGPAYAGVSRRNEAAIPEFEVYETIEAPVVRVWEALADIGSISRWNPGVSDSRLLTDTDTGVGSARHCDLGGRNYLRESVFEFVPHERLTMRVDETNLPFATIDIRFRLVDRDGRTDLTVSPIYRMKYGVLGFIADRLLVRRMYTKGMQALAGGLKRHVEEAANERSP